eukprot:3075855-Amphidinium_carterae.1
MLAEDFESSGYIKRVLATSLLPKAFDTTSTQLFMMVSTPTSSNAARLLRLPVVAARDKRFGALMPDDPAGM